MSGNRSKSAFFEGGWVTLSADFRGKGASPTNHCWCQRTRVIAVSCGIKIFAVRCLVFSQYTHLTDRRTDRQKSDSNTVRCITCSRTVKSIFYNSVDGDRHVGIYATIFPHTGVLVIIHCVCQLSTKNNYVVGDIVHRHNYVTRRDSVMYCGTVILPLLTALVLSYYIY